MSSNVALLVHACDRYELLYKGFAYFFNQHWNFSAHCTHYFATEEKKVNVKGFTNIRSGKGEWADRLAFLLKEKITEKFVLYFQEDMWLNKNTNALFFNELFTLAAANNWQQVKLHSSPVYKTISTGLFIQGFHVTKVDNQASDFLMSHQVTLWNKDFLLAQLNKGEHPWRNERKATKRLKKLNPEIIHLDYFAENGYGPINHNNNPVQRSAYRTLSYNGTLNENIAFYIPQLVKGTTEDANYAHLLAHNNKYGLTHDGKPNPKKVDIFKKMKNWLQAKK